MRLTKHHGLGNDFLVLLDHDGSTSLTADLARLVCHRTEGVGADGLIRATCGEAGIDVTFELRNADGSPAEVSGNGLRCLVQAAVLAGWLDAAVPATIGTVAGPRVATVEAPGHPTMTVAVAMGPVRDGEVDPGRLHHRLVPKLAATLDAGNPHLVLLVDDPDAVDPLLDGPSYQAQFPDSVNVEWITVPEPDVIDLIVYERGAGLTRACGSGATAAAVAAHRWGLVDGSVTVRMPGGSAGVRLTGPRGAAPGGREEPVLVGPTTYVAAVDVHLGEEGRG